MCLSYNKSVDRRIRERFRRSKNGTIVVYKLYEIHYGEGFLRGYYRSSHCTVQAGRRWSDRRSYCARRRKNGNQQISRYEKRYGVNRGYHVYLNKEAVDNKASGSVWNSRSNVVVAVPVTVREEDFIAGGRFGCRDSAVFDSIYISPTAFKRALATAKRKRANLEY